MRRCAIYIRVSTAMQKMEGWSLDAQRAGLTEYAKQKGWKVVGVYADEGKTARKRLKDRREIHHLLDDVKAGNIDIILFKELDRWFRNVSDFYKVQDILDQYGVTWVSERQPTLDMGTKEGRLAVNILLSVGQTEADATSERIRYSQAFLRTQHRWTCGDGRLPRCYKTDDEKQVVLAPEGAAFVRDLVERVILTHSIRAALIASCTAFGTYLNYSHATKLLRNPLLHGEYKGIPDFVAEPLLSQDEWDALQRALSCRVKQNKRHEFTFSGLITCGVCGHRLAGTNARGRLIYRCTPGPLRERHQYVGMTERRLEQLLFPEVERAVEGRIAEVTATMRKDRPRQLGNKAQIESRLARLEDLYINGDISRDKYTSKRESILAQLVEPEPEPAEELGSLEQVRELFRAGVGEIYDGMSPVERRHFWSSVTDEIRLMPGGSLQITPKKA